MVKPAIAKPKDLRQYAVIPILATRDPRLKPPVLKTLVALCAYADRMGRTFVSLDRIAADLGCSPSGVSKHMTTLKRLGYVTNAKPLHRAQRSKSRRIIYTPKPMTEDAIRSSLQTGRADGSRRAGSANAGPAERVRDKYHDRRTGERSLKGAICNVMRAILSRRQGRRLVDLGHSGPPRSTCPGRTGSRMRQTR
jgi:biotin operon repressor